MKRTISIIGPIGSFTYNGEDVNGVQLVDVVSQVTKYPDTKELTVEVGSLGGSVTTAKQIRNYLKSLQPRMTVTTKQVDDIASAGTIVFGSGSKRIAAKGINPSTGKPFQFMVHNSWVTHTEGNAEALEKEVADLKLTDEEMTTIYHEDIGISRENITPLMKAESYFDADKAMSLKFATETYEAKNQAAYMSKETNASDKSVWAEILAELKGIGKKKKKKVAVAPPAELMGKQVIVDGKAAVDGVYTVQGGVVTLLAEIPAAGAPAAGGDATATAKDKEYQELIALLKELKTGKKSKDQEPDDEDEEEDEVVQEKIDKAVAKAIEPFKKNAKSSHTPAGFNPDKKGDDAKEWDRAFKANEITAMKKDDLPKYQRLFYAKYGRMPN
jgi:ATP-dependent Clp protease protease subunit